MPKGGPQERIYPTQIESYSLSSKETIKVNQDLDKWQRLYPEQTKGFLFFKKKESALLAGSSTPFPDSSFALFNTRINNCSAPKLVLCK